MRTKSTTCTLLAAILLFATHCACAQGTQTATSAPTTAIASTTTAAANVGQTITLSGTSYKVSAKKVLATGVEFYTVKATTPKAPTTYFLRSNNRYNPTVFTEAQYTAFLQTGKVTSFGAIKRHLKNGKTHYSTTKGTVYAVFGDGKGGLDILEFSGPAAAALASNDDDDLEECPIEEVGPLQCCYLDCICCCGECDKQPECVADCDSQFPEGRKLSTHRITVTQAVMYK